MFKFLSIILFVTISFQVFSQTIEIRGLVFEDCNANGQMDLSEKGIEGISVSDGNAVTQTNNKGEWKLKVHDEFHVFVIKPSNYSVHLDKNNIPQHSYLKKREDSVPESINFPLIPSIEKKKFSTVFFGDTQARGFKEVDYIFRDAVEELIGTDAAFGVSLGDNVADDPELMEEINKGIAHIGIPWYNTFGNHDSDRDAKLNSERDDTFERIFGPSTYAFEYGNVAFIGLNNIYFNEKGKYRPHFTEEQLKFVESYLEYVPDEKLVVLYMHAPIVACDNDESMYKIIQERKHCFSISGHVHELINLFLDNEHGWFGEYKHHHLVNSTVCGSWWCGGIDENGLPHATMNDGAPNGYSIVHFDDNQYSIQFKGARKPEDYQMNIYLPDEVKIEELDTTKVLVNVFAGSERSKVEMQLNGTGGWIPLLKKDQIDPECLRMHQLSPYLDIEMNGETIDEVFGYKMDYPSISYHMWEMNLPDGIKPGTHRITIRTTDMYNKTWESHRLFRITK